MVSICELNTLLNIVNLTEFCENVPFGIARNITSNTVGHNSILLTSQVMHGSRSIED